MASHLSRLSGKPHHLSIMAIGFLLPVIYIGSYLTNLEERRGEFFMQCGIESPNPLPATPRKPSYYSYRYNICQKQSEVVFWPAERVHAVIRP